MTATLTSQNPATLETLGEVPIATREDIDAAVEKATLAAPRWGQLSFPDRARFIYKVRDLLCVEKEEIAELICNENGKPMIEAVSADIFPVMELATYFAKNSYKILRREKIWLGKWSLMGRESYVEYYPIGLIGIISPWNYPFSIPCGQVIMALMAGNTVVLKPSEYTPLVGQKIGDLFQRAGVPEGVVNVVTGDGGTGAALVESKVKKIVFTGSVNTGKKIMAAAAKTLTPVTLELGGKDPMIVCEDANLELAASAAIWGGFTNSGQVCASVERLLVQESVLEEFQNRCVEKALTLKQGNGMDPEVEIGAMTNGMQLDKVDLQVEQAKQEGAKVLIGGERDMQVSGHFYKPTLLTNVTPEMNVVKEETFGPVIPIIPFKTDDEAIKMSNNAHYGLTASVWTKNFKRGQSIASQLESGTVMVNETVYTYALGQTPWGGPKDSGIGRTHGKYGLLEMVENRHVHINRVGRIKDFWWYGYSHVKYQFILRLCDLFYAPQLTKRFVALFKLAWWGSRMRNI
jgi:acyl-CoA reductase-like NAD-dependent aldehyde dehydrogenase